MTTTKQHVLVIGGGFAGATAIVGLRKYNKDAKITMCEPKEYSEIAWASYRSPFDSWVRDRSLCPLAPFCEKNDVEHIRTTVKSLTKKKAVLDNGEVVEFDVCIVATGASSKWPALGRGPAAGDAATVKGRSKLAAQEGAEILNAKSVLVVGGGLIGTELAGDVAGYAKKAGKSVTVTLVHSGSHLVPEFTDQYAAMAKKDLEKLGVRVVLNDKAKLDGGAWKLEKSGETIEADKVVQTVGLLAVNDMMRTGGADGLEKCLNDKGWVQTDDYFRVKGADGAIFAIGDCCTTLPNSAAQLMEQPPVIGRNVDVTLKALAEGGAPPSGDGAGLKPRKVAPQFYMATIGPNGGVAGIPTGRWIFPWLKNKTMFYFRPKQVLGLSAS